MMPQPNFLKAEATVLFPDAMPPNSPIIGFLEFSFTVQKCKAENEEVKVFCN